MGKSVQMQDDVVLAPGAVVCGGMLLMDRTEDRGWAEVGPPVYQAWKIKFNLKAVEEMC